MSNKSHNLLKNIIAFVITAGVISVAGWVVLNRQYVLDQLDAWSYQPSTAIASITDRAGLSDQGKFYLYASKADIETAAQFNANCSRQEAGNAILGCYANKKIYIYQITNAQLNGFEEVTAAHEMLHAIWDRMSEDDKKTVGDSLLAYYTTLNDPTLNARMAYYDRTEPGQKLNELHSILGTEYAHLSPQLEAHYVKYFSDRDKVVALHSSYEAVFSSLKSRSDVLSAQIDTLKASIDSKTAQYNSGVASINSDATALKDSQASVDRTSQSQVSAYNAKRQSLLDRIGALDALRTEINNQTDTYNTAVTEFNKIAVTTNNLNKSLDSTLAPTPSL
jgi:prefoldin subunit 5